MATGSELSQKFLYGEMVRCLVNNPECSKKLFTMLLSHPSADNGLGDIHQLAKYISSSDVNDPSFMKGVVDIVREIKPKLYGSPREIFLINLKEWL